MEKIAFDYSKLKGRIIERYDTLKNFCKKTGRDRTAMGQKLLNGTQMRQSEMISIAESLDISGEEYLDYFFTPRTKKS